MPPIPGFGYGTNDGRNRSIPVPRFYFHLYNDMDVPDDEGQDLPDLAAAQGLALEQARALVAAMATEEGRIALHHRIEIEDGQHVVLATVTFRDAVEIEA